MAKKQQANLFTRELFRDVVATKRTADVAKLVSKWSASNLTSTKALIAACRAVSQFFEDATHRPDENQTARFWTALNNPSASAQSAWRTIGPYADLLEPHCANLPVAQEAIKDLARAEKAMPGALVVILRGGINANSSVGDVRKATRKYLNRPPKPLPTSDQHRVIIVATDLAEVVTAVVASLKKPKSTTSIDIVDNKPLADAVIAKLGDWLNTTEHAERLSIDGGYPHNDRVRFEKSGKLARLEKYQDAHTGKLAAREETIIKRLIARAHKAQLAAVSQQVKGTKKIRLASAAQRQQRVGWLPKDVLQGDEKAHYAYANSVHGAPNNTLIYAAINGAAQIPEHVVAKALSDGLSTIVETSAHEWLSTEYEIVFG